MTNKTVAQSSTTTCRSTGLRRGELSRQRADEHEPRAVMEMALTWSPVTVERQREELVSLARQFGANVSELCGRPRGVAVADQMNSLGFQS